MNREYEFEMPNFTSYVILPKDKVELFEREKNEENEEQVVDYENTN